MNQEPIQRFRRQMYMLSSVLSFFTTVGTSAPRLFTLIDWARFKEEKSDLLAEAIQTAAAYVRTLHPGMDLYTGPIEPAEVDPDCPALEFSDHIRALLGKNHVMFDLVHAPFTHPLGTQISFFLASNAWDAYCLYVAETLKTCELTSKQGDSDEKLRSADLLPSANEIANDANQFLPSALCCDADEIPAVIQVGKLLRNSFVHHGGLPKEELTKVVKSGVFSEKLMRFLPDDQFEVVLPMGTKIYQVLVSKVELIQRTADKLF